MKLSNRILASAGVVGAPAGPGEQNKVTVRPAAGPTGAATVEVTDAGAPLTAGPGCVGGGPAGTSASCTLHAGQPSEYKYCGHDWVLPIPGTAWETTMNV